MNLAAIFMEIVVLSSLYLFFRTAYDLFVPLGYEEDVIQNLPINTSALAGLLAAAYGYVDGVLNRAQDGKVVDRVIDILHRWGMDDIGLEKSEGENSMAPLEQFADQWNNAVGTNFSAFQNDIFEKIDGLKVRSKEFKKEAEEQAQSQEDRMKAQLKDLERVATELGEKTKLDWEQWEQLKMEKMKSDWEQSEKKIQSIRKWNDQKIKLLVCQQICKAMHGKARFIWVTTLSNASNALKDTFRKIKSQVEHHVEQAKLRIQEVVQTEVEKFFQLKEVLVSQDVNKNIDDKLQECFDTLIRHLEIETNEMIGDANGQTGIAENVLEKNLLSSIDAAIESAADGILKKFTQEKDNLIKAVSENDIKFKVELGSNPSPYIVNSILLWTIAQNDEEQAKKVLKFSNVKKTTIQYALEYRRATGQGFGSFRDELQKDVVYTELQKDVPPAGSQKDVLSTELQKADTGKRAPALFHPFSDEQPNLEQMFKILLETAEQKTFKLKYGSNTSSDILDVTLLLAVSGASGRTGTGEKESLIKVIKRLINCGEINDDVKNAAQKIWEKYPANTYIRALNDRNRTALDDQKGTDWDDCAYLQVDEKVLKNLINFLNDEQEAFNGVKKSLQLLLSILNGESNLNDVDLFAAVEDINPMYEMEPDMEDLTNILKKLSSIPKKGYCFHGFCNTG